MTDQRFTALLGKQLAGEISPDESVELKSALAESSARKAEFDLLQGYFESEPVEEEENADLVFGRIKSQIQIPVQPELKVVKSKSGAGWLKIAAAVAIVLAGILVYNRESIFLTKTNQLPLMQVQTKATENRTIVLADGSTVKMNAASILKYPQKFNGATRNVYLTGEAFFEVKKDARHPFIVHTEKLEVRVLGTAFDVKAYPNDDFTETTLIRGKVVVKLKEDEEQAFELKPNDKFTLNKGEANLSQINPLDGGVMETAWTNHELVFKNHRFEEVAKLFERWYDLNITFKDPELKKLEFTGHFNKESITEALNVLKLIENFNYSIKGKNVYIFR